MSMRSSHIYGYGFNCDCKDEKLVNFIKAHKGTFCRTEEEKEIYNVLASEDELDLEELFKGYTCDSNSIEGGAEAVITNIMSRETGIRFIYCLPCEDCDTWASIMFAEGYPWQLNEAEKNLTEEKLQNICKQYMNELGITCEPNYLSLEYWG